MYEISTIVKQLPILQKNYDCVRVLDPYEKKVLSLDSFDTQEKLNCQSEHCYSFWKTGQSCKNCISKKAVAENATFIKIEVAGDKLYMVTAFPITYNENKYVLELIRDVTEKKDFFNALDSFSTEINQKILQDEIRKFQQSLSNN
jgi:hypothetical protein